MNTFKTIRLRLGLTQAAIAEELGVSQGNVSFYERGQTVTPQIAELLIAAAARRDLVIGFDHVYGRAELPQVRERKRKAKAEPATQGA